SCQFSLILISLHYYVVCIFASDIETKDWPCPLNDEFLPCICTENENKLEVDCSAAKTEEELSTAFSRAQFPFENMDSLLIDHTGCSDCSLETLNANSFGPVSFRTVQIHGTALTTIMEGAFANAHEYLEVWDLSGNKINFFTFEVIEVFSVLETLNLKDNAIDETTVVQDIASSSLKNFYLSNNPKVVFGPNFVTNCPALEDLQLDNITLTQIPQIDQDLTSMFDGLTELTSLDLSNNFLSQLQSSSIDTGTQSSLRNVYLSNSRIEIV
ncbi:Leucine-rich repeat domain L domain-like, partial [Trinorchestia longiramus]